MYKKVMLPHHYHGNMFSTWRQLQLDSSIEAKDKRVRCNVRLADLLI
jgi:hypothetical protein